MSKLSTNITLKIEAARALHDLGVGPDRIAKVIGETKAKARQYAKGVCQRLGRKPLLNWLEDSAVYDLMEDGVDLETIQNILRTRQNKPVSLNRAQILRAAQRAVVRRLRARQGMERSVTHAIKDAQLVESDSRNKAIMYHLNTALDLIQGM